MTTRDTLADLVTALAEDDKRGVHVDGRFISWREHVRLSAQRAAALRRRLDPARPPHIGVLLPNVAEFSLLLGAAAIGGIVLVGLNTTRRGAALAADIATADCQLVIVDTHTAPLVPDSTSAAGGVPVIDIDGPDWAPLTSESSSAAAPSAPVSHDDLMMLIFTSGTTGEPKAVRCTQRTFAVSGTMLAERFGLGPDDVVYLSMPMFHSNATIAGWSVAVAAGASVALREKFSASAFLDDVRRYGVTYANYVGKPLNYILAVDERPDDADNPLRIMYGNEASAGDRRRFAERFDCRVIDGFGSTEGGVAITRTPDTPPDALGPLRSPTAIVDVETGEQVPVGTVGEIVNSSGPGLFSGYHGDDDATADRMRGGIYHTGDLGWVDDAGYVHFAGRSDDWLRVDGENLGTGPIERILLRHIGIRQVAVFGRPVEIGDEIHAVLVTDGNVDASGLTEFLRAQTDLGPKQWPHRVRVVSAFPDTATFKTVKRALRADTAPPTFVRASAAFRYENA